MSLTAIAALLQSALLLLSAAQTTANLPQSFRDNAITIAQQAISEATAAMSPEQGSTSATSTLQTDYQITDQWNNAGTCPQNAQNAANEYSAPSSTSGVEAGADFVESSHFVPSQSVCYFVLHSQTLFANGEVTDDNYVLWGDGYTASGGSALSFVPIQIASCTVTNLGSPTCSYYGFKLQPVAGAGFYSWQEEFIPPLNMSYQDYQSLVATDMSAD